MSVVQPDIPWHKYGIVTRLSQKVHEVSPLFGMGRTVLQKMIYILEEIFNVPCEYQYSLYIYGPYSTELANDLDYVEFLKGVDVTWKPDIGGYKISPGEKCDHICDKASSFLSKYETEIDTVVSEFGDKTAGELELIATIVYVDRYAKRHRETLTVENLADEVKEIKPKFTKEYINKIVTTLLQKKYIQYQECEL